MVVVVDGAGAGAGAGATVGAAIFSLLVHWSNLFVN
jgi:hypothetical protein